MKQQHYQSQPKIKGIRLKVKCSLLVAVVIDLFQGMIKFLSISIYKVVSKVYCFLNNSRQFFGTPCSFQSICRSNNDFIFFNPIFLYLSYQMQRQPPPVLTPSQHEIHTAGPVTPAVLFFFMIINLPSFTVSYQH